MLPILAHGDTNQEIAGTLRLSPHTVATYRKRVMKKLDLHRKTEIMKYALERGLFSGLG